MDSGLIFALATALLPGYVFATLTYAGLVKYLERSLTFWQALMICGVATAASFAIYVVYVLGLKAPYHLNKDVDGVATLVAWSALGIIITRLAANYGIKKYGWLGVGGRANLYLLMLLWALIAVIFGVQWLLTR
jgi:hypothetical protein